MNCISLGYACPVAHDLELLGLRSGAFPFDWVISDFEGVMNAIENGFVDFLDPACLSQSKENQRIYKNTKYNICFFHDFDEYLSLKIQLPKIRKKYRRRIKRFYDTISHPTCFVRYISDEETLLGKSTELIYIEKNYAHILSVLKSFNEENTLLFIANEGVRTDKFKIYTVSKDENDIIARSPLHKNQELFNLFSNLCVPDKQKNLDWQQKKEQKKKTLFTRSKNKLVRTLKHRFLRKYIHSLQYETLPCVQVTAGRPPVSLRGAKRRGNP